MSCSGWGGTARKSYQRWRTSFVCNDEQLIVEGVKLAVWPFFASGTKTQRLSRVEVLRRPSYIGSITVYQSTHPSFIHDDSPASDDVTRHTVARHSLEQVEVACLMMRRRRDSARRRRVPYDNISVGADRNSSLHCNMPHHEREIY